MEVAPVVLQNVVFDRHTRTFHSDQLPAYPLTTMSGIPLLFSTPINPPQDEILTIERPTYAMIHFHWCFGHAYVDTCIPLLSILHEYDSKCLEQRGFQLFILKELPADIDWLYMPNKQGIIDSFHAWETKTIDYTAGTLKGAYRIFHAACSDSPILFERSPLPQRYIQFTTLLYGGNTDFQRCIHNSSIRYPGRRPPPPVASDKRIIRWVEQGKAVLTRFLDLSQTSTSYSPLLFLARKETRSFDEASLEILSDILNTEPVYFENIPFKNQIERIRAADTIVAAHGSGLCHLIWCRPGTHLIEIFATDDPRKSIFESFCAILGLRYTRIECSTEKGETDAPIHISPKAFSQIDAALEFSTQ